MLFFGIFYVIPVCLLNIPFVQDKLSGIASEKLHETLGVEVGIGKVDFELFNKIIVKDLYLEDRQGEVLFRAKRLAVGFEFIPLLKGKIKLTSAQLFTFDFNLSKETKDSPLNLQFVIDAFSKKDTIQKENTIDLEIRNLNLRRGNFSYHVKDQLRKSGKFDANHIVVKDISTKIQLNKFTESLLDAQIERLSLTEQSGLVVRRLSLGFKMEDERVTSERLELQLPGSMLVLTDIAWDFRKNTGDDNTYPLSFHIASSGILPKDLSGFVPAFQNYKDLVTIQANVSGNLKDFAVKDLRITGNKDLVLYANILLRDVNNTDRLYMYGSVIRSFVSAQEIEKIANNLNEKAIQFPQELLRLGNINFEGIVAGYLNELQAHGVLNTDIGNLVTDIEIGKGNERDYLRGRLTSDWLDLQSILLKNDFGDANFDIQVDIERRGDKYSGTVNALINSFEYKKYMYENIKLIGKFTESSFDGVVDIDAPDGKFYAEGFFNIGKEISIFNFTALAERINLDKLNINRKYKESELSFNVDVNFTGSKLDNSLGYININDIRFSTPKAGYYLDTLQIHSNRLISGEKSLVLNSDLINGKVEGNYSFKNLGNALKVTAHNLLPALVPEPLFSGSVYNDFYFDLVIEDLEDLSYVLELPVILNGQTTVRGNYNTNSNEFGIDIHSPEFYINKMHFTNTTLEYKNVFDKASLNLITTNTKNEKDNRLNTSIKISDNSLQSTIRWNENTDLYNGNFELSARFYEQPGKYPLKTEISIFPSYVNFMDSLWTIHSSMVTLDSAKINIQQLRIEHADQYLKIDGTVSHDKEDLLRVDLNKVNLDYIFDILNIAALDLGGIASGYITASDIYETRELSTNLDVKDFSFNQTIIGDLDLAGVWDEEKQGINMRGYIHKNDSSFMNIDGYIYPVKEELSMNFEAHNTDAAFLRKYLNSVANNISGELTGDIHLYGGFKNVTLEGDVFVNEGSFGIDFLNTTYRFSDYVRLKSDEIALNNVLFYDRNGRTALVNGSVRHNFLKDFHFNASLNANNFLVFNAMEKQNPSFFGIAYGTGSVNIYGNESLINFDISMRTDENTRMTLNFMEAADITEYDFINFVSHEKDTSDFSMDDYFSQILNKPIYLTTDSKTDLRFNLQLEATPNATIEMIMDASSGDKIRGYGQGNLQIQYGTKAPLKLFGKYTLERGFYNFSLQQVIYRDFQIREGSSIYFQGDPYTALLDINAIYTLNANIADLNENLADNHRTNIPVNCVLYISGDLERPEIKFGIELPNSNEELERQIRSIINTEDMMNRQIVYLLVLNKFYTMESGAASGNQRSNEFAAVAAATLSSQLNNLLGSLNENVQIGTKIITGDKDYTDTEIALMLSSQLLNNRLIFNGNFGYRDNAVANSNSSFIGDFYLEYKLTKTGDIRLKAYNHNDERFYSLKTVHTIQGLGIMYRKDFDNFRYLFRKKKLPRLLPEAEDSTVTYMMYPEYDFINFKK